MPNSELLNGLAALAIVALWCWLAWRAAAYRPPTDAEWAERYEWDQRTDPAEPSAAPAPPVNDFTDTDHARALARINQTPLRRLPR